MKQGNSSNALLSKFFKVYLPEESKDDLELPIFCNSFLLSLPRSVFVRSINGKTWKMELRKCHGDEERYVLVDGWKRIAKDEDLNGGDFLVFEFDGSRCFNFCIYESLTMCKRFRRSSMETNEIKTEVDEEEEEEEEEEESRASDVNYNYADDNDASDVNLDDNDDDDSATKAFDNDVETIDVEDGENDFEADDEIHYLDDPENPSFKITLNPKKKSQLRIPAHIMKDYGLSFGESITIVDPLVSKFGTMEKKIKIQSNGSVFVKGFGSVVRRNKVKTSDKMLFELKKTGSNLVHTIKINVMHN